MHTQWILLAVFALAACGNATARSGPGKTAEPFGPLVSVKFGMKDVDLVDVLPQFEIECLSKCAAKAAVDGIRYDVQLLDISRRVEWMSASLDGKPQELLAHWGPGTRVVDAVVMGSDDDSRTLYINADRTILAWVTSMTLRHGKRMVTRVSFWPFVSLEALIDPARWSVAGIELLGRNPGDVRGDATVKGYEAHHDRIGLPPTELGDWQTTVYFEITNDVVSSYRITLPTHFVPGARQTILDTFARAFGQPTPQDDHLVYPTHHRVTSRAIEDKIVLEVELAGG